MDCGCQSRIPDVKSAFTGVPFLTHFELAEISILQMDASGFTIASILNKYEGFGIFRMVNFNV